MGSLHLQILTRIATMNPGCSTPPACAAEAASARRRPGSDFARASRNHPLPRRAAERALVDPNSRAEPNDRSYSLPAGCGALSNEVQAANLSGFGDVDDFDDLPKRRRSISPHRHLDLRILL